MKSISLKKLKEAAEVRPSGYLDAMLSAASSVRGNVVLYEQNVYLELRKKYSPHGLGDTVARVAKPIAIILDAALGTNLVNCGKCTERQDELNNAFPKG